VNGEPGQLNTFVERGDVVEVESPETGKPLPESYQAALA